MGVKWYEDLYENYANSYQNESFVSETLGEVDFIEENKNFDLINQRETFKLDIIDDNGVKKVINDEKRYYSPSEIKWRLNRIGFNKIYIVGCKLGEFSRNKEFNKKDMEFLVLAKKE
ncbi:MAG: hypothetical protein U5K53_00375 [Halanaerobiales bacterium]|nr:hypothetical protein [Halanaerobiales bacterium]